MDLGKALELMIHIPEVHSCHNLATLVKITNINYNIFTTTPNRIFLRPMLYTHVIFCMTVYYEKE